ncbi:MetQ/NlpA family ABC transporter substrate-binding protein [Bacillus kwashiorkori]|uniref:MetQ/NlpA family ABC transporter substrate-binding protein n=1 Tax=Bacillus kwashiorkori TaxID=1522318 RepID=UPI000781716C|nr:MetQ/NlpA family ABC transporter substrate-binding protein [Bacillus kwashiorkori]
MKKIVLFLLTAMLVLSACGKNEKDTEGNNANTNQEEQTLRVASLIPPMTEILDVVKPLLKEEGINLEVEVLSDNVQPNDALAAKEVDANFFQHVPYMEEYNENKGTELVPITPIYHAIYGVYSKKYKSIDEVPNGASVAIANDSTNIGRSLVLLHNHGVIKLKDGVEVTQTTQKDIIENEKNLKFKEVDLLMLARMYDEADIVVMTPAYAAPLGLTPKKDALITEGLESEFAITLVARKDNADSELIKKLAEKMTGPEVKKFLEENYNETAIPAF